MHMMHLSHITRKPALHMPKQLITVQLYDKLICFCYIDRTFLAFPTYKISKLKLSSVAVQPGLCFAHHTAGSCIHWDMLLHSNSINQVVQHRMVLVVICFDYLKLNVYVLLFM